MSATKGQRIGIWIIAAFMAIGTIGSFAIIVLANDNAKREQDRYNTLLAEYQAQVKAQDTKLSEKYYGTLTKFNDRVSAFNADDVTELKKEDLLEGDGATLTAESSFTAYYTLWGPKGTIIQTSAVDGALSTPVNGGPGLVIEGWTKGVDGMKVGGVRELSIPSAMAYGETGSGADIPPNTPLKFIVLVIPTPEQINPSAELEALHARLNG